MSLAEEALASIEEESASHGHNVTDPDNYFVIDPDTREISSLSPIPNVLMQYDHNSEVYTFELPRYVEGHDMTKCNRVRLHYINIGSGSKNKNADVVEMSDLAVNPKDANTVISTWTIRREATQLAGTLNFLIQYMCIDTDGNAVYEWHTDIYTNVTIKAGMNNSEAAVIEYSDILEEWYQKLFGLEDSLIASVTEAAESQKEAIEVKGAETLASIPEDYTSVANMAEKALRAKANAIVMESSGESIFIDDSADAYLLGLNVYGKTTQVTTSGKQLLNNTATAKTTCGITFTPLSDGSISISGTATGEAYYIFDNGNEIPVCETPLIASISGDSNVSMVVGYFTDVSASNFVNDIATVNSSTPKTLTFPSEAVATRTFLAVNTGKTVKAIVYPLLRLATIEDDTYEPYSGGIASPSPDWPQELASIENPTVGIYGKNLLEYNSDTNSNTNNGVTFTIGDDGGVTCVGTATDNALFNLLTIYDRPPQFIAGKSYTVSGATDDVTIQVYEWQEKWVSSASTKSESTFTVSPTTTGFLIRLAINPQVTVSTTVYPTIRLAEATDSSYEKYKDEQSISLARTLSGIPVTTGGNYTDQNGQQWICDEIDLERGVYVQRIIRKTFAGSSDEIWRSYDVSTSSDHTAYQESKLCSDIMIFPGLSDNTAWLLSNKYSAVPLGKIYSNGTQGIAVSNASPVIRMCVDTCKGYSVDEFTAWLADNPFELVYPLATPIETALTDDEIAYYKQLKTHYYNTTVLNDVGACMAIRYAADTKMFFENHSIATDSQVASAVDSWLTNYFYNAEEVSF